MALALCFFYIFIFCFFIYKSKWFAEIDISFKIVILLYLIKLLGGFINHYVMMTRFYGGDSHAYYLEVHQFFAMNSGKEIFNYFVTGFNPFKWNQSIFSPQNAISWSDLGSQLNIRLAMICEFLGGGSEYVYVVIYNSIFFIGQYALFKGFCLLYPNQKVGFLIAVFLIPSVWFWCSGVHKDGFQLATLGGIFYNLVKWSQATTNRFRFIIHLFILFIFTFLIRYHIIIAFAPALFCFIMSFKYKLGLRFFAVFIVFYAVFMANIGKILPQADPLKAICYKQSQFFELRGKSWIDIPKLEPTATSFLSNIPIAYNHVLMRPYLWEAKDIMYAFASIETLIIFILMIISLSKSQLTNWHDPFIFFSLCLVIIMYLVIGYIVPFSGAFVRYRATFLPFLLCSLIAVQPKYIFQRIEKYIFN
jgi:hypothetical protein